jgi:hypothetical protein
VPTRRSPSPLTVTTRRLSGLNDALQTV